MKSERRRDDPRIGGGGLACPDGWFSGGVPVIDQNADGPIESLPAKLTLTGEHTFSEFDGAAKPGLIQMDETWVFINFLPDGDTAWRTYPLTRVFEICWPEETT